jgi:two-component system LytT family response regulator
MDAYVPFIKVLIVDDEKKACANLYNMISDFVDAPLQVCGIAYSTAEAELLIQQYRPDAIFLDIQMPHENAFDFLERISPINFEIIFVTAYDEFAVRAFKLSAVDYILKPISIVELSHAVGKLQEKIQYNHIVGKESVSYATLSRQIITRERFSKITLRGINGVEIVDIKDISFIEALSSYSKIQFYKNGALHEITMSNPLSDYEEILPEDMFFRIHRSYLVNCAQVVKIETDELNNIIVKPDVVLPVSRRRVGALKEFLMKNEHFSG